LGFDIISTIVNTGSSAVPLRVGYRWSPEKGEKISSTILSVTSAGNFKRDRFLQQVGVGCKPGTSSLADI
jgi:hypothetical protein